MLAAMRSPMRRSAATESSEPSPSEGSEPLDLAGATAGDWASDSCADATHSQAASASLAFWERINGSKSNYLGRVDGAANKLL